MVQLTEQRWNKVGATVFLIQSLAAVVLVLANFALPLDQMVAAARTMAGDHYAESQTVVLHGRERTTLISHLLPSLAFTILGMLQLWPALRKRGRRAWHRWIGRTFILVSLGSAVTGAVLSLRANYSGWDELVPSFLFAFALVVFCVMGWIRARQRDFQAHQEWMILALASGLGITLARVYLRLFTSITGLDAYEFFGAIFWMGSGTNIVLALIWIGVRRRIRTDARSNKAKGNHDRAKVGSV